MTLQASISQASLTFVAVPIVGASAGMIEVFNDTKVRTSSAKPLGVSQRR
jgi:hypothetical protein